MAATPKHSFTKEQVAEYQENFKEFDADGSGTIEPKELKAVLERCGVESTDAQVSELIRDAAKSGKEELDFDDFLGLMWKMQSGPSEKDIRTAMFEVRPRARMFTRRVRPRPSAPPPPTPTTHPPPPTPTGV